MANNNSGKNEKDLVCSFCGKHQDEVERMIIGPGVNICSECIGLCHDLLSDQPEHPEANGRPGRGASRTRMQAVDGLDILKTCALQLARMCASPCAFPLWGFGRTAKLWNVPRLILPSASVERYGAISTTPFSKALPGTSFPSTSTVYALVIGPE